VRQSDAPSLCVEAAIAVVLEEGEVTLGYDTRDACRFREVPILFGDLIAQQDALLIFGLAGKLLGQLLPPCLDCEISLAERNDALRRVGVLHDEVAGVARQVVVIYAPMRSLSDFDHANGSVKMIGNYMTTILTSSLRPLDNFAESLPARIAQ
jgi:hypothetical protein